MNIYCLDVFKKEYEQLISKKPYKNLEQQILDYFFEKEVDHLKSGTNLNNNNITPYIKKRIKGSGGYRFYYLLIIKDCNLYLMYLHPKTGPKGARNITDETKAFLYKQVLECINANNLFELKKVGENLTFTKVKSLVKIKKK